MQEQVYGEIPDIPGCDRSGTLVTAEQLANPKEACVSTPSQSGPEIDYTAGGTIVIIAAAVAAPGRRP
jgi:hypothetical protein